MKTVANILAEQPSLSDAAALAAYMAQVEYRRVPIEEVNTYLIEHFLLGPLQLARENAAMDVGVRGFVGTLLAALPVAKTFDGTNPVIQQAVPVVTGALVQAGVMTQADADGFIALMREPLAALTLQDVAAERRRIAAHALRMRWAVVHNAVAAKVAEASV